MNLELFSTKEASTFPDSNKHIEVNWDFIVPGKGGGGVRPNAFELGDSILERELLVIDVIEVIFCKFDGVCGDCKGSDSGDKFHLF